MKTISRYIMTLALLLTAVGGAWAQDANYDIDVNFDNNYNPEQTPFDCNIHNVQDLDAEIKGTLDLSVDDVPMGSFDVDGELLQNFITPGLDAGDHTWTAVFKPVGGGEFSRNGNFTINKAYTSIYYNGSTSINLGVGESTELDANIIPEGAGVLSYSSSDASVVSITKENSLRYIIEAKAAGTATITFSFAGSTNYEAAEDVKITVTVSTPPIDVTTNAAEEGATFTEASFEMPTYDVNVNYELVRDMTVDMTVTVQDADKNSRFRVQKQGNSFVPVGLTTEQVMALFTVHDDIEEKNLTANTDYTVQIFAVNEEGQKTGEAIPFNDFTFAPGNYVATAVAASNSNYSGETALSNVFTLFQGYEVTVPAGEYVTYYKDEALYVEDTDAKLYTITSVNETAATATLSDAMTVTPANTPLLVYNSSEDTKTFLLIPTTDEANNVTTANEFKGTLEATQIAASTANQNNYAFNGKEFVWVKDALDIAANKAWLSISGPSNTRSISIVFDSETTGIDGVSSTVETGDGNWYDLNGRKFTTKPTKKGVYIVNGKKVVIKN